MKTILVTAQKGRTQKQIVVPAFNIAYVEETDKGTKIHLKTYPAGSGSKTSAGRGSVAKPIEVVNDLFDVESKINNARG